MPWAGPGQEYRVLLWADRKDRILVAENGYKFLMFIAIVHTTGFMSSGPKKCSCSHPFEDCFNQRRNTVRVYFWPPKMGDILPETRRDFCLSAKVTRAKRGERREK